jgi:Domain of unknown function (DUF4124)
MMIRTSRVLLVAMAMLFGSVVVSSHADAAEKRKKSQTRASNQKGIAYRWVDDKGVVHYGDRLPAHYEDTENSVLNRQGVEIQRNEGPKTPEELAAERERQQQIVRQKQHDRFLMTTYASVADIERLRDERLGQIQGQRGAAEQYVENLFSRLSSLQTRAMVFKPYSASPNARRMPDDLAEDLVRTLNEMRVQRGALAAKDEEEALLRSQFEADITRYRELRAARLNR